MAGLFDQFEQEFDVEEEPSAPQDGVARVLHELNDTSIDDELREAEKKLTKASYYKAIVRDGVMVDDGSDPAREVNGEARLWARQQMAKLLGLSTAPVPTVASVPVELPFNPNEILALKKLAEKVLLSQGMTEPTVKHVQTAPPAPTVRQQPAVQQIPPPAIKKPSGSTPPAAQPVAAPTRPSEAAPTAGKPRILRPRVVDGKVNYDKIPTGEIFRDPVDKRLYKYVPHPTEDNRRVKRSVTQQVRNSSAMPMPPAQQMEAISQVQSAETVNAGKVANTVFPDEGDRGDGGLFIAAAAAAIHKD